MDYLFWVLIVGLLVAWIWSRQLRKKIMVQPQNSPSRAGYDQNEYPIPITYKKLADFIETDQELVVIKFIKNQQTEKSQK